MTGSARRAAARAGLALAIAALLLAAREDARAAKPASVPAPPPKLANTGDVVHTETLLFRPQPFTIVTDDSVRLAGSWYHAGRRAPVVVLAPRRRGTDAELATAATELQRRGFNALVFSLRDSQPANRERDSLRYAVIVSHWVDDMVGALRAARRADSTAHVYAWGQGLGAALAVSAAARSPGLCDALAAEDVFPTVDWVMRQRGTAVIPDAVSLQWRVMKGGDEPFSSAARLNLPVYAILVGPHAGESDDLAWQALRRNRGRTDRWLRPGVGSPAPIPVGAQYDTLAAWFRRWDSFPIVRP